MNTPLQQAAKALINRWDSTDWKDTPHTAHYIEELRKAVNVELAQSVEPEVLMVDAAMVEMKNIVPPLRRSECLRLIRAAINATAHPPQPQATTPVPEGYVLVPVDPTDEELAKGVRAMRLFVTKNSLIDFSLGYRAMLAAAQGEKP